MSAPAGIQGNNSICFICNSFGCSSLHVPEREWMQRKLPPSVPFAKACDTLRRLNQRCRCNCGKNHAIANCLRCGQSDCYAQGDCTYCTHSDCAQRLILMSLGLNNCPRCPTDVDLKFADVMAMCSQEECRSERHHAFECPRVPRNSTTPTCACCGGVHEKQRCPFALN